MSLDDEECIVMKYIILINECRQENSKLDIQVYCDESDSPIIFQTYQEAQEHNEKKKLKGHIAELPDSFTKDSSSCYRHGIKPRKQPL